MSLISRTSLALAAGVLLGTGLSLTHGVLADRGNASREALPLQDLQTFVEILNRVKTEYVEEVDDKTLLENAVRGMLTGLDPHSAFLDADDEWLPEKLARQLGWMQAEGLALTYTGFWRVHATGRREVRVPARVDRQRLLRGNVIGVLTAICDRDQLGPMAMPLLPLRQDYAFWLDLLKRTEAAHGLQVPLAIYHVTPGSLSANRWRASAATWRMYREHAGLGPLPAAWYLASHVIRRLIRG